MAEQVHRDIRVLRGIPEDEFMDTMGFFAASLSMNCTDCHVDFQPSPTGPDLRTPTPNMKTARKMVTMVRGINRQLLRRSTSGNLLHLPSRHARPAGRGSQPGAAIRQSN